MKNSLFYLFKAAAWTLSIMPFPVIYLLSDFLGIFLQYIIRYRKRVVDENLKRSFPEWTPKQLKKIRSQYYQNLADIVLEVIKMRHLSPEALKKRFRFENQDIFRSSLEKNRSVLVAIGHYGNWEWMGTALGLVTPQKGYALVKPLTDQNFHQYMEQIRHRMNPDSTIPFKSGFRVMVRRRETPTFYVTAADQTPTRDEATFWTTFLHQDTPFFQGIEKIAVSLDMDVVFIEIQRSKRGYYVGRMQLVTDRPKATKPDEITLKYIELLQNYIRSNPANWLWSHRRWKHSLDHASE